MKSIRTKILVGICAMMLIALSVVGTVSSVLNYKSTLATLEQTLTQTVSIAGNQVASTLSGYKNLVFEMANNNILTSSSASEAQKIAELNWLKKRYNFDAILVTDASGVALESGMDISDREYFQRCRDTDSPVISDPIIRKDNGTMAIMAAAPIHKGEGFGGAVIISLDASFLSQITSTIQVGNGSTTSVLNKTGDTIGYPDQQFVLDQYNTQKEAASDSSLKRLAAIEADMCAGKTGFADYSFGGKEKMTAYCPVPETDGWSICISIAISEFLGSTYTSIAATLVLAVLSLLVAVLIAFRLANSIAGPIKASAQRLELLAQGDLDTPVPTVHSKDETALLASSMASTVSSLRSYIEDMTQGLGKMAQGDLNLSLTADFKGDFVSMRDSMEQIADSLNATLAQINTAAEQVSSGSEQVSSGAQALSQGATEQASSVEELAATITEISQQVGSTAQIAAQANRQTVETSSEIDRCNTQMQELTQAITEISGSSQQIGRIIKTIEDIAFQTNILALNAAVEAARAGAAGKGFAVVADEVRNLASKSAEAAKNTTALIESSIHSVEHGTRIAQDTAGSLAVVVEKAKGVAVSVDEIAAAAGRQATSILQVNQGVDQISSVVQTNSATAEQSAAASEELSSQASMLKNLVGRFRLQGTDPSGWDLAESAPYEAAQPYSVGEIDKY